MEDIITNFKIKLLLKDTTNIQCRIYYISGKFYTDFEDQTYLFNNKQIIKKFINQMYKSHYYKNNILQYEFSFNKNFILIENEYMSSRGFASILNDFLLYLQNINIDLNEKITQKALIKYSYNDITRNIPQELIEKIIKFICL